MVAASKPVSGQPIETSWGSQVHDVAVLNRGVIVTGAALGTNLVPLPMDTIINGDPALVDLVANNFVAPVDGVYELLATIGGVGQATGGSYFAHVYESGGSGAYMNISGSTPSFGASVRRYFEGGLLVCTAGQRFNIVNSNPGTGGTQQIERASWRLIAQGLGVA